MTNDQIICSVCARGGSKGVPGKNLRPLNGRPLLLHTLDQARQTGRFAAIAVSSDDDAILSCAREWGADVVVRRPDEMASDTAAKSPSIRHCVETAEAELGIQFAAMVDLDATSPLREPFDIEAALDMLLSSGCNNVISVTPSRKSPYFNMVELNEDDFGFLSKKLEIPVVRRQDAPKCFDINGSVYAWTREAFFSGPAALSERTRLYIMPEDRSIDIDSETDWLMVEFLMSRKSEIEKKYIQKKIP
ncbi:flagellar modification protein B [Stappia sp. GBMRC 2046]|uniref:Flagellar modification protein B n=1 Tax=Stappia sediminis TaxID=2692190 RepID=A0A7X3LV39_9HYPH|nr:acylneuraminate cytidylyltransferase family protein [Stappia sediminis]MXN65575.1 flagellar modification protein B [Stappia sediminis]